MWKWHESHSVISDTLGPPWNSLGQNTGVDSLSLLPSWLDLSNPGIESRSPTFQVDSLPAEPQRKPNNTGVGSLSLLQRIFPTQESNWGLLYCRRILYQLSYQGSAIPLLDKDPRELKMYVHRKTHVNIHSHIIYHNQKVRMTQISINWWMDYQNEKHPNNGTTGNPKKNLLLIYATTWINLKMCQWKKLDTKDHILYDSVYKKCPSYANIYK